MVDGNSKILIVEDAGHISASLKKEFEKSNPGYKIKTLKKLSEATGENAINSFSIVILDFCGEASQNVPLLETVSYTISKSPETPFLLVTEPENEKNVACLLTKGMVNYILKTEYYIVNLSKAIRNVIDFKIASNTKKFHDLEMEHVKKELQKVNNIKAGLIENLCHELRTPLSSIRGYTELVLKGKMGEINAKQNTALNTVLKNADKLLVLIDELSDFSKIQNFKETANIRKIDLINIVQEVIAAFASRTIEKKLSIEFSPKNPIFVSADYSQMSFVFNTLLNSSIKNKKSGDKITLTADQNESHVLISVSGTSLGIDDPGVIQTFERFLKSDSKLNIRDLTGLSVELSLIAEILKMHEGNISFNVANGDSNAIISLPLYFEKDISYLNAASNAGSGRKKILVTDDDPDCVNLIKTILENDYNLIVTNSAQSMFKALEEHKDFSLILLDINMVDLDGISICRALKEKNEYSGIPILMVSASMQETKKQMSLEAGALGFLEKPFEADTVLDFIKTLVH